MHKIIALAPMDGITNNPYRMICKHIWDNEKNNLQHSYDFYRFTEFMTVEGYIRNPRKVTRHILTTIGSEKTIAQIYGGNHGNLLQTAIDVDNKYPESFSGIELNIGCPSPKIMSCEAGSGMLKCRPKTLQIIKDISTSIKKPFSIKTRSGLNTEDIKEQFDFIIEAAYHCKMITIHGRNYKQSHSGEVNWNFIQSIKNELISRDLGDIKIIGNGGLKSAEDGLQYLDNGLDGIMLGQAAMCNPWSLVDYKPNLQEIYDISILHLHLNLANERYFHQDKYFDFATNTLIQPSNQELEVIMQGILNGELSIDGGKRFSLIEFRKHLFWYVSGLVGNNEFKRQVAAITDYQELKRAIDDFFKPLLPN